ncbi:cytochrome P450 [Crepidotus variabilis]|uniref:Cytochrome P450 n=1 Tax=Crepidotus variabilis TaxID=179855 RepID=A0A9P6ECR3_9AGAR|nr:cytochrome P450 [Crepidotus variabilis]
MRINKLNASLCHKNLQHLVGITMISSTQGQTSVALATLAVGLLVMVLVKILKKTLGYHSTRLSLPFPPGPPTRLFVGNALDFPSSNAHRVYTDWGKKYQSDILHASAFGSHVVIINNFKIADELLEKRAQLYNDRPDFPVRKIIDWDYVVALMRHGDWWIKHRKAAHQLFYASADKYLPIQVQEVHAFLRGLLRSPEAHDKHSKMLSISIPLLICFGYKPDSTEDRIIEISDQVAIVGLTMVQSLINIFPVLRYVPSWVPGATSRKLAEQVNEWSQEMKRIPINRVKADCTEGKARSSVMADFYGKYGTETCPKEEETILKNISFTAYTGAADTTISATGSLLYLMATHPEIQKKAQDELDAVLGYASRLPEFTDRPALPYIEAIYREILRMYPPLPLSLPHSLIDDDVYEGYFLPKGTTVIGNVWAMCHHERVFPEPFAFKPERFMDKNGRLNDDRRILAYGFGRRVCVGKAVASNTMWLNIASFLACFDIGPTIDKDGKNIEIDDAYIEYGAALHKKPFKCLITPRSVQHSTLIEATADSI